MFLKSVTFSMILRHPTFLSVLKLFLLPGTCAFYMCFLVFYHFSVIFIVYFLSRPLFWDYRASVASASLTSQGSHELLQHPAFIISNLHCLEINWTLCYSLKAQWIQGIHLSFACFSHILYPWWLLVSAWKNLINICWFIVNT